MVTATITFLIAPLTLFFDEGINTVGIGKEQALPFSGALLMVSEAIAGFMLILASVELKRMHFYARFIGTVVTIMIVDLSLIEMFLTSQNTYDTTIQLNQSFAHLYHHSVIFLGILLLLYFLSHESSRDMTDAPAVNSLIQEPEVFIRHIGVVVHVLFLALWPLCIGRTLLDSGFALYMLPLIEQVYITLHLMIPVAVVTAILLFYRMPLSSRCASNPSKGVTGREGPMDESGTYSLQEVHDRIKNNLQLVCSLLSLQGKAQKDSAARAILRDTTSRVAAIATLYRLSDICGYRGVNLNQYFNYLGKELLERYEVSDYITCNVRGEVVQVQLQTALYCGLMFNEIVTNSIRHGFPVKCSACVSVAIEHTPDRHLSISIQDNGIGVFRDNGNKELTGGLGTRIISQLAKQMRAKIEEVTSPGHGYKIHVPL